MRWKSVLPAILVAAGLAGLTAMAVTRPVSELKPPSAEPVASDLTPAAQRVDQLLKAPLQAAGLEPAKPADELTVLRRLSLSLLGTVPSLEEIRRFEADTRPGKLAVWTNILLSDPRFADYFAERLARSMVGTEGGQFIIYRRDRFLAWLSGRLKDRTPYDQIVKSMISETGVPTDRAAVNFVVSSFANDEFDPNKLAGRTARAFLGQRIDCAQCHDHPFAHWKQSEFAGLAACYSQLALTPVGIVDRPPREGDKKMEEPSMMVDLTKEKPRVPFGPEWFPTEGAPRERLAAWITHPQNKRFERAIANRVWGLMFGRPYFHDRPVDDLPDPEDPDTRDKTAVLDVLGADFRAHNCDLRRLIQVIASTEAFRRDSRAPGIDSSRIEEAEQLWAVFPLTRLRPEQVIGAMLQSNSVKTINQNSHLFARATRFFRERDYVNEFGDPGDAELEQRAATITQMLLNMNGDFAREMSETGVFVTPGVVRQFSPSRDALLENAYLTCLTRRPTDAERGHFLPQLPENSRETDNAVIEDLYWTLFNTPEFSWGH